MNCADAQLEKLWHLLNPSPVVFHRSYVIFKMHIHIERDGNTRRINYLRGWNVDRFLNEIISSEIISIHYHGALLLGSWTTRKSVRLSLPSLVGAYGRQTCVSVQFVSFSVNAQRDLHTTLYGLTLMNMHYEKKAGSGSYLAHLLCLALL